jgi:nicotinate phosphoribosyltransferase
MGGRPLPEAVHSALFADLYELTMAQAYQAEGMGEIAVFELYFREMPARRNYLVAAGLDGVLTSLENLRFDSDDLEYLRGLRLFSAAFLELLESFRFRGAVWAVPEGTPVFANEPLVQVIAPIVQGQLIETLVLNEIQFPSLAAAKAARVVKAAGGREVIEFGARRAQGEDAALAVARACYLMGAAGTSNVLAAKRYGIPVFGTMAHSYIQAHDDEGAAFASFVALYPETTLLVDTYDTLDGVRKVIELSRRLGDRFRVRAIRLDSGDLGELARQTRQMLDEAGLDDLRIFASGGLDEYQVADLVRAGAPIDMFGVGTKLVVSEDVPALDLAYKLVEYAGRPRMKLASQKEIYPGRKQVFRVVEEGSMARDIVVRHDESAGGQPLLVPVMEGGVRLSAGRISLKEARLRAQSELARLPESLHSLDPAAVPYQVDISPGLEAERSALVRALGRA